MFAFLGRGVGLKFRICKMAVAAAMSLGMATAQAEVLTFDDLGAGLAFFTSNYRGFQFGTNNAGTNAWFYTSFGTVDYVAHSGVVFASTDFRLYSGAPFQDTQPISSAVPFTFDGAWFTGDEQVRYKLFRNGELVFTSADSPALSSSPIFVASGYAGAVDAVVVVAHQGYFAMDDFTFNTPIPEPGNLALMSAGLAVLGLVLAKRRS